MGPAIAFGIVSAVLLGAAFLAVHAKNLVHSVLWLAVTLVATAALYVALEAPLLAGMQVVLYTGGVITLMLFGVLLTDTRQDVGIANLSGRRLPGFLMAIATFGVLAGALWQPVPLPAPGPAATPQQIGQVLLSDHLVAFEALSVLLLAALLGAVVLARKSDA